MYNFENYVLDRNGFCIASNRKFVPTNDDTLNQNDCDKL